MACTHIQLSTLHVFSADMVHCAEGFADTVSELLRHCNKLLTVRQTSICSLGTATLVTRQQAAEYLSAGR